MLLFICKDGVGINLAFRCTHLYKEIFLLHVKDLATLYNNTLYMCYIHYTM